MMVVLTADRWAGSLAYRTAVLMVGCWAAWKVVHSADWRACGWAGSTVELLAAGSVELKGGVMAGRWVAQ